MRRHEHDRRPLREIGEDAGEFDAGEPGHVDVEEDRVDACAR